MKTETKQTEMKQVTLPFNLVAAMYDSLSIEWKDDNNEVHQKLLEVWERKITSATQSKGE